MYLAKLTVKGFRRIHNLELRFRPGLNVLVGPNNVGKTAVVDALRALLASADEGRLPVDEFDLHVSNTGAKASSITFQYVFRGLTEDEEADFLPALKPMPPVSGMPAEFGAHLSIRYSPTGPSGRLRPRSWCGDHEENAISVEMREDLRAVYLPPLRDPAVGLRPSRTSQLARLIDRLADDAAKKKLVDLLKTFEDTLALEAPVAGTQIAVVNRHQQMLGPVLMQLLKVGLTPPEFQRIAARLALTVESLDVEQNGLGYNNLIYMAVVLTELALNPDAAYKALIVEEPEAHLHPQLQAILLDHFQSIEKPTVGEKAVQVFVTSHSPNFASIANIDTLACMHQSSGPVKAFIPREAPFDKTKKEKLQRYLDVTRAELFFAKRIILVEGTAERFLISAMAEKLNLKLRQHAVSVLSTEGLNFDCFVPLFGDAALPVRVAILSDADPPDAYPKLTDSLILSTAANAIHGLKNPFVTPFFAQKTLEYDLALHHENRPLMLTALAKVHPTIASSLTVDVDAAPPDDKPKVLFCGMFDRASGANVKKGQYSQALAQAILEDGVTFIVPPYIQKALEYVTAT